MKLNTVPEFRFLDTAIAAAREAGRIQRERARIGVRVSAKGDADITTDVDDACERAIVSLVRSRHPSHEVLGEEGTTPEASARHVWIVDPLDGTKNYAHGYPRSAVSIALEIDRVVQVAVVYNARADELFVAERGRGATLNGEPIRVSTVATIDRAMIASALTYDGRHANRAQLERLARVLGVAEAVRSDGCAALDLCDVACGRFDAYFEPGLKPWDTAAGALIVQEAGGTVTGFEGRAFDPHVPELVATNGAIHRALLDVVG
jgi:myo-inositol-1(or 4)-monophosphatase